MSPLPAFLLIAAAAVQPLSPSQQRTLDKGFICPEKMADDAARLAAVTRFMQDYARLDPRATVGARLAYRDRQLVRHKCAADGDTAHYSFPQT